TTRVFAPAFDNPGVDMEGDADIAWVGDLSYVTHPDRPSVDDFLLRNADRCCFVNGLVVPSVNHRICLQLAMTGRNAEIAPDWPTLIAADQADIYGLPHAVVGGQPIPGRLGSVVVRIGGEGQVEKLLSGSLLELSDDPLTRAPDGYAALLDAHLSEGARQRVAASAFPREAALHEAYASALERAQTMKSLQDEVRWATDGSFASQVDLATDLLSIGMSRCCTLAFERATWDSHESNDDKQADNFEDLFAALGGLMDALDEAPGNVGERLSDETVVVVMSEMGRTPQLNSGRGKDHWAHTSAMLIGPGVTGGQVIGGYDELFYGRRLDLASARIASGGRELTPGIFGATLLALADVDSTPLLPEDSPIEGMLT
ncbi:MAG: DUF1501 domain-containing protein, partial [Alphaproteobacteria bacterium]|nr:DUF1501 domain-containing protein [Alphaproteobacteria bacterium]